MAGSYVTRAAIPTRDICYSLSSDEDSDYDDLSPLKAFQWIGGEMEEDESLDFMESLTQILRRDRPGSWQLPCL